MFENSEFTSFEARTRRDQLLRDTKIDGLLKRVGASPLSGSSAMQVRRILFVLVVAGLAIFAVGSVAAAIAEAGDSPGSALAGEREAIVEDGDDLDLAALHARNFAVLLARERDQVPAVAASDRELAALHARNFAEMLVREADETSAVARSEGGTATLHARNFAELLARQADEASAAVASEREIAGLHARNFAELLAREADEAAAAATPERGR
jgi:hypothetical protein